MFTLLSDTDIRNRPNGKRLHHFTQYHSYTRYTLQILVRTIDLGFSSLHSDMPVYYSRDRKIVNALIPVCTKLGCVGYGSYPGGGGVLGVRTILLKGPYKFKNSGK